LEPGISTTQLVNYNQFILFLLISNINPSHALLVNELLTCSRDFALSLILIQYEI